MRISVGPWRVEIVIPVSLDSSPSFSTTDRRSNSRFYVSWVVRPTTHTASSADELGTVRVAARSLPDILVHGCLFVKPSVTDRLAYIAANLRPFKHRPFPQRHPWDVRDGSQDDLLTQLPALYSAGTESSARCFCRELKTNTKHNKKHHFIQKRDSFVGAFYKFSQAATTIHDLRDIVMTS